MATADLNLLETIDAYYAHPYRMLYSRCWGCEKRRIYGEWWEGYQVETTLPHGSTSRHWGYFCSSCIVLVASMCTEHVRLAQHEEQ